MNFWHMQLHPNDRQTFTNDLVKRIIQEKKVIGLGEAWKDKNGNDVDFPRQFSENMKIGDIVLVRHTINPIALVEVASDAWCANDDEIDEELDWFQLRRNIKILGFFSEEEQNILDKALSKKEKNHIPASGTLGICSKDTATGIFISEWLKILTGRQKMDKYKNLLLHTHNLILHGAPGTGKTHLAKEIAKEMGAEWEMVQFHPSYDYTDFVEGLRPVKTDDGNQIGFERKDGVFKEFCAQALENFNGFSEDNFDEAYQKLLDKIDEAEEAGEPLFYETLTHKKKFAIKPNSLRNIYAIPQTETQTHMPITKENLRTYLRTGEILDWKPYLTSIAKHLVDDFGYKKSEQVAEKKPFLFIIDEINRGEISKIFGELFFSIDPGYRAEKGKISTQYQNLIEAGDAFADGFFVPENVYIIGTMNDIDRSVESMDFAFRRRFTFCEIKANENLGMLDELEEAIREEAKARLLHLNKAISKIEGLSSAYHIGGAYFLKLKELENDFDLLWTYHLEGLLREYLRGMEDADALLEKLKSAYNKTEQESE